MTTAVHKDSELERLVALEAELEAMLSRARDDARALVERERAQADATRATDTAVLEAAIAGARQKHRSEREQRAAAITAEAVGAGARYDAVSDAAVAELGVWVVGELLSGSDRA